MARIVITSWGSFGDVYPYVDLARALVRRGHDPVLAVPRFYADVIKQAGIEHCAVGPNVDPDDRATIARVMDPIRGTERLLRDLLVPALRQSYQELELAIEGADLLVSHPITFAAPVLAEKRGMPWVSTVLAPLSFFSTTNLPVLSPMPALNRLRVLGPWFARLIVGIARHATRPWMEPVQALRAEAGLPTGRDPLFEGQFSPMLTLALFSRVLAMPQPDWPPRTKVTGFMFYNGPDALDPSLEAFLAGGPAPVVFTLGTSAVGAAGTFYEESVDAVHRLGVRAVLLTGGFPENQPIGVRTEDVFVTDRAPHQLLFPHASAIVHQGGVGTTAQALRAGRPMVVVPHAHDQPDNAFRVTRLGVAQTMFPRAYKAARIARMLASVLGDSDMARRASEIAAVVRSEGGADAAAQAIAELCPRTVKQFSGTRESC